MRELGIIDEEAQARGLADYLLTLDIPSRVVANRDGRFAVWVQHEDKVARARAVFDEFRADPDDPRFRAATRSAREIRRQAQQAEKEHRRASRNLRDRWEGALHVRAPFTSALIAACVALFAFENFAPGGRRWVFEWLRFSLPYLDPNGFIRDSGFEQILGGQVWRLVTPAFLHADFLHILFNMLALASLGQRVEVIKGKWRYLLLVLVAAVAGDVGQFFLSGGNFRGMSGVVFGVAGYLWIKGEIAPEEGLGLNDRSFRIMVAWFLIGILAPIAQPGGDGFLFHMANAAHGVGLASGLLLGLLGL